MARKYSRAASSNVERAVKKQKAGTLKSGGSGKKVTSRKQAIAIGLSEARAAGKKAPEKTVRKSVGKSAKKTAKTAKNKTSAKKTSKKTPKKKAEQNGKRKSAAK